MPPTFAILLWAKEWTENRDRRAGLGPLRTPNQHYGLFRGVRFRPRGTPTPPLILIYCNFDSKGAHLQLPGEDDEEGEEEKEAEEQHLDEDEEDEGQKDKPP